MADETPIYDPFLTGRGHIPPGEAPRAPAGPAQTSGMATWSVVLGVLGFTCLPAVGGLLALTLGIAAKSEISRSEGRKTGSGLAITGALLGAANLLVCIAGFALLMILPGSSSGSVTASPPTPAPYVSPAPIPTFGPAPAPSGATPPAPGVRASSREPGVTLTKIGKIDLVDIDPDVSSLGQELDKQRAEAKKDDKTLLLWVVVKDCQPCNGVAAALPDARMQTALERVRLVRVDGRELGPELTYLGIPTGKVPGFALLGHSNRPVDYVNGGEWDEDIPRNIAPVLGKFVARRYAQRREQWRGTRRDDETTL